MHRTRFGFRGGPRSGPKKISRSALTVRACKSVHLSYTCGMPSEQNLYFTGFFLSSVLKHVGSVEEIDAKLDGAVDGADRLGFIAVSIKIAHAHAADLSDVRPMSALGH